MTTETDYPTLSQLGKVNLREPINMYESEPKFVIIYEECGPNEKKLVLRSVKVVRQWNKNTRAVLKNFSNLDQTTRLMTYQKEEQGHSSFKIFALAGRVNE